MATPNISLAQFNKIATGDYNAGQIDFRTKDDGSTELIKVNNHVWKTRCHPLPRAHPRGETCVPERAAEGRRDRRSHKRDPQPARAPGGS